jgi:hypothetical protein
MKQEYTGVDRKSQVSVSALSVFTPVSAGDPFVNESGDFQA